MNKAWLAGFADGEGCIGIYHNWVKGVPRGVPYVMVQIAQKEKSVIDSILAEYPEGGICRHTNGVYSFRVTNRNAERILRDIYPFLIVKKDMVSSALKYFDALKKVREENGSNRYSEEQYLYLRQFVKGNKATT